MSSFGLKVFALILMIIDHAAEFLPGMPVWMRWIGRLAAPIFIFCSVWSFTYTRDRKKYLFRLYIAGVIMSLIQWKLYIPNNFFRSLFSLMVILYLFECYQKIRILERNLFFIYAGRSERLEYASFFYRAYAYPNRLLCMFWQQLWELFLIWKAA